MKTKKIMVGILVCLGLFAFSFIPAGATIIETGDEVDIDEKVEDDLIASGGTVDVNEDLAEDSFIFGGQVSVNAPVSEDLIVLGGQVDIDSNIGGDVIIAGGQITIAGNVSEDVIIAGGSLLLDTQSTINGDVIVMGGDIRLKGAIDGELRAYAGNVTLEGEVKKKVDIKASNVKINGTISSDAKIAAQDKIEIGDSAKINGNLNYWQKKDKNSLFEDQVTGKVIYDEDLKIRPDFEARGPNFVGRIVGLIIGLLRAALIIGLISWLCKKLFKRAAQYFEEKPWNSLGYGTLYMVLVPVISLLLMIIVIGMPLGALTLVFYIFGFLFFLKPVLAYTAAYYINRKYKKKWDDMKVFWVALGIVAAIRILKMIPIIGGLFGLIAFVAGLAAIGALIVVLYSKLKNENKKA